MQLSLAKEEQTGRGAGDFCNMKAEKQLSIIFCFVV
jgi:hypothetical protein